MQNISCYCCFSSHHKELGCEIILRLYTNKEEKDAVENWGD
jgi:hypothetical protein